MLIESYRCYLMIKNVLIKYTGVTFFPILASSVLKLHQNTFCMAVKTGHSHSLF